MGAPLIVCMGEILVDFVSTESGSSLINAPRFEKAAGGAPANVAAGVARLGLRSAFLGKVGRDPFGDFLRITLDQLGVNVAGLVVTDQARTTLAFVSIGTNGERDFVFFRNPGADQLYRADEIPRELIESACIFHFGSISMTGEPARTATLEAAMLARQSGALVSYDPNLRLSLWESAHAARDAIHQGSKLADIVKVSEEELDFLPADLDPRLLVITRGREGCSWRSQTGAGEAPAFQVDALDTTGAGDAFMAALLSRMALNSSLLEDDLAIAAACRFACAAGAFTTTRRGAIPALPSSEEIERTIRSAR